MAGHRKDLIVLANELRHARTRHVPLEIAERVQHAIVRLEQLAAQLVLDEAEAREAYDSSKLLLDYCSELVAKG